jgi:hypothetical protein
LCLLFLIFAAKYHINHQHTVAKKLTHKDFPNGGYLLIHTPHNKNIDNEISNRIDEYEEENALENNYLANDILTEDMVRDYVSSRNQQQHHKNRQLLRFQRSAGRSIVIEHCCPQSTADVCGKYFCH